MSVDLKDPALIVAGVDAVAIVGSAIYFNNRIGKLEAELARMKTEGKQTAQFLKGTLDPKVHAETQKDLAEVKVVVEDLQILIDKQTQTISQFQHALAQRDAIIARLALVMRANGFDPQINIPHAPRPVMFTGQPSVTVFPKGDSDGMPMPTGPVTRSSTSVGRVVRASGPTVRTSTSAVEVGGGGGRSASIVVTPAPPPTSTAEADAVRASRPVGVPITSASATNYAIDGGTGASGEDDDVAAAIAAAAAAQS